MDRPADAARWTGQTLAWFDEGEAIAESERRTASELTARRRGRAGTFFAVLILLAILGAAGALAARHLGLVSFDLPWGLTLPWE